MTPQDEVSQMISDCEAHESRLSEWEAGFIDSISTICASPPAAWPGVTGKGRHTATADWWGGGKHE